MSLDGVLVGTLLAGLWTHGTLAKALDEAALPFESRGQSHGESVVQTWLAV